MRFLDDKPNQPELALTFSVEGLDLLTTHALSSGDECSV